MFLSVLIDFLYNLLNVYLFSDSKPQTKIIGVELFDTVKEKLILRKNYLFISSFILFLL